MKTSLPIKIHHVGKNAFSLVELLVAVALMTVIIIGLYSMFNETQKALRTNVSQVDVLEAGRSAIELIVQDIQQAEAPGPLQQEMPSKIFFPPSSIPTNNLPVAITNTHPHFFSGIQINRVNPEVALPLIQNLADHGVMNTGETIVNQRVNILQEVFFLTRSNLNWVAKGYFVSPSRTNAVLPNAPATISYGTLFRFSSPNVIFDFKNPDQDRVFEPNRRIDSRLKWFERNRKNYDLLQNFWDVYQFAKSEHNFRASNLDNRGTKIDKRVVAFPLIDGVVHFKMQPIDSLGQPMRYWMNNPVTELSAEPSLHRYGSSVMLRPDVAAGLYGKIGAVGKTRSAFYDDALPAYVELEIGILDPITLEKVKSMEGNARLVNDFLRRQAGNVHLFRRMIRLPLAPKIMPKTIDEQMKKTG